MIITKYQKVIITKLKILWTPGSILVVPGILSRNIMIEEYQKHQLQHKPIPRDFEFFDENGTPVSYQSQHEDNPIDTCKDFCAIKSQRDNEEKTLRLHNHGEEFMVNSVLDEFAFISIQQASDFFRMGRIINSFRRVCGPGTPPAISVNTPDADYSSINYLMSTEDDKSHLSSRYESSHHTNTDSEDDNIKCAISTQTNKPDPVKAYKLTN